MRICIFVNTSWNIANFRRGLVKALLADGHEVWVLAPYDAYSDGLEAMGCKFRPLPMDRKGRSFLRETLTFARAFQAIRRIRPDLTLLFTIKPNLYGALASRLLGIPSICNVTGLGTTFLGKSGFQALVMAAYRLVFRFPFRIFFQNPDDRSMFLAAGLATKDRSETLPGSGIDLDRFNPAPLPADYPRVFLMASRLLYAKGIREYLEAARQIQTRRPGMAHFQLAGAFEPNHGLGLNEQDLAEWTRAGFVTYHGFTDDIKSLNEGAHCVVLPSYREGTPRALLEGAAQGRILVATDVPGCRQVVENEVNGFLCTCGDSDSLADAMERVIDLPSGRLQEMANASRVKAVQEFSEERVINAYLEAIRTLPPAR